MLELLFLLLPVSVAYGWVMGKHSGKKELQKQQVQMSRALTSSVTLLLKNKEEQALDSLIQYLNDNPQSIENYLTMAQIFRKKGEIDKAISIHEGLLNSEKVELSQSDRELIELELARDFMSAGIFERALKPLENLLNSENSNESLALMLHIYEQTREWQKGIDAYLQMSSSVTEQNRQLISHFYCEVANATDNVKNKKQAYKRALKVHSDCIRSLVSLAQLYLVLNQKQKSRELIVQVLDKDPNFAPALFSIAPECFVDEFEQAAWLYWLIKEKKITSVSAHNQMANYVVKENGLEEGRKYIINHLKDTPSVRGFAKLIELEREFFMSDSHFEQIQTLINQYIELKPNYECKSCGFSTNHFSWRCPACNSWQTIKPLTGLDGI